MPSDVITVAGGGLAGCEAAWRMASNGLNVTLQEMRPDKMTPAHTSGKLGELVCSNSLGADDISSPAGILKRELRMLGSLIMKSADANNIPAGKALAVDRDGFSAYITEKIESHPSIVEIRSELKSLPDEPCIIATGPLTSETLALSIREKIGDDFLYFFDAVAPVVTLESVDMDNAYWGGRWGHGDDYLNCMLDENCYYSLWKELTTAIIHQRHEFEKGHFFEGCLPIEEMARRGKDTLRYGPMRPVGLPDPRTGKEPFAVVQLRRDNKENTLYNLVGFQTNIRWGEQERILRMIPALRDAEFVRLGVMHKNIYVNAPVALDRCLRINTFPSCMLAGQIVGVEGYLESAAMGLVAGINYSRLLRGKSCPDWPAETAIGSLLRYLREAEPSSFQPMNVNLGIFPPIGKKIKNRLEKCNHIASIAISAMDAFIEKEGLLER